MADKKIIFGLSQNTAATLAYAGIWVTGLFFFLSEKKDKFVRFHALQSLIAFGILTALMIISSVGLSLQGLPFLNVILLPIFLLLRFASPLLEIIFFILWLVCIIKAYQGEEFLLPFVGQFTKDKLSQISK